MTVVETRQNMEREGREAFEDRMESRMEARFDKLDTKLNSFMEDAAEKRGRWRGALFMVTLLGSSTGTSALLLLKHLMFGAS